ncbi:hypothetical protein A2867_04560 [Candidatus Daviesbacteria bacterium RIFCSPHIGHO2_01_FULL_40_11]|uniref:Uncharacterized protein n=1 Tax=Candidatus Daviesbacteria bacterium RIFCSPHIGHO2_01_FULL_40_11 TaxID=1797762 RepID=A0A1F5JJE6_9BACT|nr:MAG: hypothetical protein A2867_04560 [Candidatus Daviesbacteria bacterium RIFCSPHIGHO2_01_FULL_40_11]
MNSKNILGGILGSFEDADFERETSVVSVLTQGVSGVFKDIFSLGQDIAGIEPKSEKNETGKFPLTGSIDFKNDQAQAEQLQKQQEQQAEQLKERANIDRKKAFFQALKEDQERAKRTKEKLLFEEEINDIVTNLPTEQKNELLHYQASYRDRSIYQRAELRKKLIEQSKNAEKQEKTASVPSPAKQPAALEGAFEGRSGSQGGGTANLSAQAVG